VLSALPFLVAGGLLLTSPGYLRPLLHQPTGHLLLWTAAGLQLAGIVLIGWLVRPQTR
jgi:Flp pilus assembly protein TadB